MQFLQNASSAWVSMPQAEKIAKEHPVPYILTIHIRRKNNMNTYNSYLTGIALRQSGKSAITIYKVRAPKENEIVVGYEPTSDFLYKPTETEIASQE